MGVARLWTNTNETTQTETATEVHPGSSASTSSAKSSVKTSQGGGGQHAVMPPSQGQMAQMNGVLVNPGVNMISSALNRTIGGGRWWTTCVC